MPWTRKAGSNRKEIVHIVVTGYHKRKDPRKHYVFVVDVTWNNSERYETYRRYSDFFSFQTTLKQLFPAAAGRRGDVRSIPQLPKRIFVGRSHVAKVAEARLEQINRYCQTLISLDPKISESAHVIGFFSPRIGDKQLPKLHLHRPASIHPKKAPVSGSFEEYCALAEFVAEDSSQVSFNAGDKVVVMSKDESGWWMCGVDGKVGWAPPSYLKKCTEKEDQEESDDSDDDFLSTTESFLNKDSDDSGVGDNTPTTPKSGVEEKGFHVPEITAEEYKAIENYEADGPGQVSFEEGDIIHVLDKLEDGWWFVSNGQDEGWAPCSYLERLNGKEEEETISSLDIEKYYSVDDYEAEEDDEISFPKGAVVDVLQKRLDGWWFVKYEDKTGLAPATFLRKGLPPAKPDLATIQESVKKDSNSLQVPNPEQDDEEDDDDLAYENVEFQVPRAQPPRRESVRKNLSVRKGAKSKSSSTKPPRPPLPDIPTRPFPNYANYQPPSSPVSSDSDQESMAALKNKKKLSILKEEDEKETTTEVGQHNGSGSLRSMLAGRGDVRNRIKAFEMTSGSETSSLSSVQSEDSPPAKTITIKPPVAVPRARVRNQSTVENPGIAPSPHKESAKKRSKSTGTPPVFTPANRPPPPPRNYTKSPTTPKKIPIINEQLLNEPSPVGPRHLPRPSEERPPSQPPRPTLSVYKRAKDRSRSASPSFQKQKGFNMAEESEDSSDTNSVQSYRSNVSAQGKPRHKVKKTRSQSSADQLAVKPLPNPPVRRKTSSESANDFYPPLEAPPKNTVEGAIGGEDGSLNEEMAGTIIKYILASPDPKLKAALKDLITSDQSVMKSMK